MKSRDEFVKRWSRGIKCGFMHGSCSCDNDGQFGKAGKVMGLKKLVMDLLAEMYDDAGLTLSKTKQQFIKRWMNEITGGFYLGLHSDVYDDDLTKTDRAVEIVSGEADRVVMAMYDHLAAKPIEPAPKQAINGYGQHKPTFAGVTR